MKYIKTLLSSFLSRIPQNRGECAREKDFKSELDFRAQNIFPFSGNEKSLKNRAIFLPSGLSEVRNTF